MMDQKKEEDLHKIAKWIKYLIHKVETQDKEIQQLKSDLADVKKKEELLGKVLLYVYDKN